MSEMNRPEHVTQRLGGGSPLPGDDPLGNLATVLSPVGHRELLPVAGLTVAQIRQRLADRLNIGADAQATINGQAVGDDVVLRAGEALYFRRAAGEKGLRWATPFLVVARKDPPIEVIYTPPHSVLYAQPCQRQAAHCTRVRRTPRPFGFDPRPN